MSTAAEQGAAAAVLAEQFRQRQAAIEEAKRLADEAERLRNGGRS